MSSSFQPTIPRPSSSLIVVDEQNRLLMVQRNPNSKSFAGAYVFPGGNYDPVQDTSNRMTAIRETFEETGLLLASVGPSTPQLDEVILDDARKAIHAQTLSFTSFLTSNGLTLEADSLLPFTQWITPSNISRRFHTHFFITFLPSTSSAGLLPPDQRLHQQLPTPDGEIEVISAQFLNPRDVLVEFQREKIVLMPPQFYILTTLASILTGDVNTSEQKDTITRLARGAFGRLTINPRVLPQKDERGHSILTYEGDEARGGHPGARHRVHVRQGKGGMHVVTLERNFDIFSDLAFRSTSPKL